MKTTYSIEKHRDYKSWTLWKNTETLRGVGCFQVMTGTFQECKKKLEELNGSSMRKIKSSKQRARRKQSITSRKNKATKKRAEEKR